ncbi:MAG: response regulator [Ignavibacteria bacterium]|nr:response regulator [Ignavibacteria bacterium]
MNILIADDDPVALNILQLMLERLGHDVSAVKNGNDAWNIIQQKNTPHLLILDRQMPGMLGEEICKKVREQFPAIPFYIILITGALKETSDIIEGLQTGADDYITKPFVAKELQARVQAGVRILHLEFSLAQRILELENALLHVQQLQGLLPICSYCKKIRDDKKYWHEIEEYIIHHSEAKFSHGICPDCYETIAKPQIDELKRKHSS